MLGKKKDCIVVRIFRNRNSTWSICSTISPVITHIVQAIFVNKARGNVKVSAYDEYVLCKPYALKIL